MVAAAAPAGDPLTPTRPLDGVGRWLRLGPLLAIAVLGLSLAVAARSYHAWAVLLAAATIAAAVVAAALLPWRRWQAGWQVAPVWGFLPAVALLEYAVAGYVEFVFLAALPVMWAALFHTRPLVTVTLVLVGLTIFGPPLLLPGMFPETSWGTLVLFYALSLVGGPIAQHLVSRSRESAAQAMTATRRAETATQRARADRELLDAYLDNAGCLVAVLDRDGQVVLFNRFAEQVLGFRTADMVGRVPWDLADHDVPARIAFEQVRSGQWPVEYEDDITTRWGTRRRIAFTATALVGGSGQVTHVISAGVDITEQRAAEQQARADRDLLNAYLDSAPCLVIVLDRDGRVTLFNRYCETISGFRAESAIGGSLERLQGDPEGARQAFNDVMAGAGHTVYEGDWIIRDGTRRRIGWSMVGLAGETGQASCVICVGMDLTDVRAGQRLSKNVLRAATEQIIMATDTQGRFTVFNPGAERYLGYAADEVIGKHGVELVCLPEELASIAAEQGFRSFYQMLTDPAGTDLVPNRELTLVRKDGTRFPAMVSVSTMRDTPSRRGPRSPRFDDVVGFVAVARDVTVERAADAAMLEALARERVAAERLRQLDQVKNDFVATVSHDLRTPLTSIIGNTELLLEGDAGALGVAQHRLLEAVDRNARRLDTLVGDLLLLSRIESGTLRIHPRPVAVREIVDGAMEALASKLSADVRLDVEVPAEPVVVQGDRDQLERVATNLVGNALKFTPPGGRVSVDVVAEDQLVRLSVCDTGIGIPVEELPHVFDRFFRSSRSQQEDRPGTGLGLTIAKSIVEHHGGTIKVSANLTGGTTFTITLPRLVAATDTPAGKPA